MDTIIIQGTEIKFIANETLTPNFNFIRTNVLVYLKTKILLIKNILRDLIMKFSINNIYKIPKMDLDCHQ